MLANPFGRSSGNYRPFVTSGAFGVAFLAMAFIGAEETFHDSTPCWRLALMSSLIVVLYPISVNFGLRLGRGIIYALGLRKP
jgi:hypothetical protein